MKNNATESYEMCHPCMFLHVLMYHILSDAVLSGSKPWLELWFTVSSSNGC